MAPRTATLSTTGEAATVRGAAKAFGGRRVLDHLDLTIGDGEFVALLGRSGSGKSTLLRLLAGLDRDHGGHVGTADSVMVAFQEPRLLPWKKVGANVVLGLDTDDPAARAASALSEVGLADHADAWPATLSGGEAQRASLARALVRDPGLLLLDEPFGALDALTRTTMHDLVLRLWRQHRPGILLITHDVDEALQLADRVLVLTDGRISREALVGLERPRHRQDPHLVDLRTEILGELGVNTNGTA